jgi:hypothetical protein
MPIGILVPMVPKNPDSAGKGLLGEDSPVGTVLRPGSLAIIAGKEANLCRNVPSPCTAW